jgi:hypothetical protein
MKQHLDTLRFILAETVIGWALHILPRSPEQRELAIFITQSWIGKPGGQRISTNAPSLNELQRAFREKCGR